MILAEIRLIYLTILAGFNFGDWQCSWTKLINTTHQSKRLNFQKLLSTQRVTQRGKRKAPLKGKSYESSGLILQNKYLFKNWRRDAKRNNAKNLIKNILSDVKLEGRKLFSSTSCHNNRQLRFVWRFCCFSLIDLT